MRCLQRRKEAQKQQPFHGHSNEHTPSRAGGVASPAAATAAHSDSYSYSDLLLPSSLPEAWVARRGVCDALPDFGALLPWAVELHELEETEMPYHACGGEADQVSPSEAVAVTTVQLVAVPFRGE